MDSLDVGAVVTLLATRTRKRSKTTTSTQDAQGALKRKKLRSVGTLRQSVMKENCPVMQGLSVLAQQQGPPRSRAKENATGYALRSRKQSSLVYTEDEHMEVAPAPGEGSSPLPPLAWVRSGALWAQMRSKDCSVASPESSLRLRNPSILPSMRTILVDWMMEVCEEYKLHRETFYLAVDMYDRFVDVQCGLQKEQLQRLGITCLFISAKIEEIYPPKVTEFAYVTDGACAVTDILDMELVVCKALNWRLNHQAVTVNTWAALYMQLASHHLRPLGVKARELEVPAYSCSEFTRVMQLLDMCTLDMASRQFSSSILAAAAVFLTSEKSRANITMLTGLELSDIQLCVNWVHPMAAVLGVGGPLCHTTFRGVPPHDSHNIQTHSVSISMLEDAAALRRSQESALSGHLSLLRDCSVFMTPPRQDRRCLAPINSSTSC